MSNIHLTPHVNEVYCILDCERTKMKLPSHAQQQDAAESGPAHSEQHRDNIILQEIDAVSRADLSVGVCVAGFITLTLILGGPLNIRGTTYL